MHHTVGFYNVEVPEIENPNVRISYVISGKTVMCTE